MQSRAQKQATLTNNLVYAPSLKPIPRQKNRIRTIRSTLFRIKTLEMSGYLALAAHWPDQLCH